jgi:hypothetical protein
MMSDTLTLEPTEFTNLRTGHKTLGWRAYDDYGNTYNNTLESIPDSDLELLDLALDADNEVFSAMLDSLVANEGGMTISGEFYDWEQIKPHLG